VVHKVLDVWSGQGKVTLADPPRLHGAVQQAAWDFSINISKSSLMCDYNDETGRILHDYFHYDRTILLLLPRRVVGNGLLGYSFISEFLCYTNSSMAIFSHQHYAF
jgi:hypothetical protein